MPKGGFISTGPTELTWHAGPARMRHVTQGHMAERREPTQCLGGTKVARTRGRTTQVHADAQVAPRGSVRGLASEGPTG